MLQQTQVATVIDYYLRFMDRFPDVQSLSKAELDEVLHHWTGLGYYARARNLHKSAKQVMDKHQGIFPHSQEDLEALPGIGRSTAGAIRAIAQNQHASILDGNVKRVLTRFHAIAGYPGQTAITQALWSKADQHTPSTRTADYTQAIMDLGATLCTRRNPRCVDCPMAAQCAALEENNVHGYPTPKPKKVKPIRQARFFVVSLENGATLLEQKPLNGLWGGLWSPLERDENYGSEDLLTEIGCENEDLTHEHIAPIFRHTFTHFHLDIQPVYLGLKQDGNFVADNDTLRWVFPSKLKQDNNPIGLSAPAVKLLASLEDPFATETQQ